MWMLMKTGKNYTQKPAATYGLLLIIKIKIKKLQVPKPLSDYYDQCC